MTRNDVIRSNSKKVVNDPSMGLGRTWSYARLTSNRGVDPRTYEPSWTDFVAIDTGGTAMQDFDEEKSRYRVLNYAPIRCAEDDPSPQLKVGDLVRSPEGITFSVDGIQQSGPGTVRYSVVRDDTLRGDLARGGGV